MRHHAMLLSCVCTAALLSGLMASAEDVAYTGERPPNAAPGECWCLYTLAPQYKTVTEQVMVEGPRCTYETIPAVFETRTEKVCVRPESKRRVEIPAEFGTESYQALVTPATCRTERIAAVYEDREERVCVRKESTRKVAVPAIYRTEDYKVCVAPARTEWRRAECAAMNTSANMKEEKDACYCLVEIPAKYEVRTRQVCVEKESCRTDVIPAEFKTVTKRVCVKPESEVKIAVPAVYETRTRQVCIKAASCTYEVIPAEFKTVDRQVCVSKESKRRFEIPARYETRSREVCVSPARKVWRRSECNAAATNGPERDQTQTPKAEVVPVPVSVD